MDFIGRQEFWNIGYPMLGAFVYIVIVMCYSLPTFIKQGNYYVKKIG